MSASSFRSDASIPTGPSGFVQAPVIQVQSSLSLQDVQFLLLPNASSSPRALRLLTPSPSAKAPVFAISTPTDKNAAASEGSTLWVMRTKPWGEQIDELVDNEKYLEALSLLQTIEEATLQDKVSADTSNYLHYYN